MKQIIYSRLLHFFILGFALYGIANHYELKQQRVITCLTPSQMDVLISDWQRSAGRSPTAIERSNLVDVALNDQMLVKEAMLQGLHKSDPVIIQRLLRDADFLGVEGTSKEKINAVLAMDVAIGDEVIRRRLIQIMQHNNDSAISEKKPSTDELAGLYRAQEDLGVVSSRATFDQLFFDTKAGNAKERAVQVLRASTQDRESGDVFIEGKHFASLSEEAVASKFGSDFSRELYGANVPVGEWFGPLSSVYGFHLVRVTHIQDGYRRAISELGPELERIWRRQQEAFAWQDYVKQLRARYGVSCHAGS